MGLHENEKFKEVLVNNKQDKQLLKEEILDENHKKVSILIDKMETKEKLKPTKKPFFKLGLVLIIVGIICLLIMNFVPWAIVTYDNKTSNIKNNEIYYYTDKIDNFSNDTNFSSFFESKDSYMYFGVNSDSIKSSSITLSYLLYAIIALGVIFTIVGIFIKRSDFPIEKYKLFQCFFAFIAALICLYFIFITINFMGANFLILYNGNFISANIENLAFIFISPIVLLIIGSGLLKLTITVLKMNFNIFEKNYLIEKTKNKSLKIWNW